MPNILHLLDLEAGGGVHSPCAIATGVRGFHHEVWMIGSSRCRRRARAAGIAEHAAFTAPCAVTEAAWRAGVRARQELVERMGEPDLAVCWSVGALALARIVFGRAMPRLGVMIEEPRPVSNPGLARRRFALDSSTLLAIGESTAESWRRAGASDVRSADPEPGLAPASDHDRVSARRSMHIEDDRIAVAMLADRPECCSARRFAFILGLLYTTGCSVTGIFPAGAGQARRAARFARAHGRRWSEVMWEGDTRTMIDACDIAICDVADRSTTEFDTDWLTPTAGAQTLAIACARGVPVIVPRHPLTEELGRAGWPLTIALGGNQIDLAAALLPLASGTGLRTGGAVPRSAVRLPAAGPMRLSAVLAGLYTELAARAPGAAFPARSYIVGAA